MMNFSNESQLKLPVINYFKTRGYTVKREIKIGFCIADIVAFKKETVVSIELKLSDWKKAIVQAKNYQLGSDYVYIAFPLMSSFNVLRKAKSTLQKNGIGFLVINDYTKKVNKIIDAEESTRKLGRLNLKSINRNYHKRFHY